MISAIFVTLLIEGNAFTSISELLYVPNRRVSNVSTAI